MRVALTYRVLQHWRVPVFQRLANWPDIDFRAFHGADIPGTQAINGTDLRGFAHKQMATLPLRIRRGSTAAGLPLCPLLPWHLARFRPDVILAEGNSNLLNNLLVFAYAAIWRTPIVFWTLGELRQKTPPSRTQRLFRRLTRWMESRSAALLGYSSLAIEYFDRQGFPKERQFRAVNCVDTDQVFAHIEAAEEKPNPYAGRSACRASACCSTSARSPPASGWTIWSPCTPACSGDTATWPC